MAIVAAGVISPLGFGLAETAAALRDARDCISPVRQFDAAACRCQTAGQIDRARLRQSVTLPRSDRLHPVAFMTAFALGEALAQAPGFVPEISIFGTTSGGMSFGEEYYRALAAGHPLRGAATRVANYPPQKPLVDAQEAFGIHAPCQVIANACASGSNALGHAYACIRSGRYQRVLSGGYDAISELVFVGFDSLQAATPEKCRPFDRERTGLVLGEGAAVLALENMDAARARGATILGEITGYGISTDNHHLTQPHPSGSGPRQSMQMALRDAALRPEEIDYVNAHGTATPFNDAAEGRAIVELFGSRVPVSSTKAMMGHSLGAAGAIEAVISLLALREQFLPPNLNFRALDDGLELNVIQGTRPAPLRRVLSNSFGFGGANASLILEKAAA